MVIVNETAGTADSFLKTISGGDGPGVTVLLGDSEALLALLALLSLLWLGDESPGFGSAGSVAGSVVGMAQKDSDLEPVPKVVKPAGHGRQGSSFPATLLYEPSLQAAQPAGSSPYPRSQTQAAMETWVQA